MPWAATHCPGRKWKASGSITVSERMASGRRPAPIRLTTAVRVAYQVGDVTEELGDIVRIPL